MTQCAAEQYGRPGVGESGSAGTVFPPALPRPHAPILPFLLPALLVAVTLRAAEPAPSNAAPAEIVLQRLERSFAGVRTVQATFRQERRLAMFNRAVVIEGRIDLEIPGRMAWHVEKPLRYAFVLDGARVRQWDAATGRVVEMAIDANPVLKTVAQQMPRWFAGQFRSMSGFYAIAVESERPCILTFTPPAEAAERMGVGRMTVAFREDERYVQTVRIEEPGGDVTTIEFADVRLNEPISPRAWEVKPRG